jgi:hypothetical protein
MRLHKPGQKGKNCDHLQSKTEPEILFHIVPFILFFFNIAQNRFGVKILVPLYPAGHYLPEQYPGLK